MNIFLCFVIILNKRYYKNGGRAVASLPWLLCNREPGADSCFPFLLQLTTAHALHPLVSAKIKNPTQIMGRTFYWRKRWDSNPRAREDYLISSQARYDHFDTFP